MDTIIARSSDDGSSVFRYYWYEPSLAAAILFIVLFGLATATHVFQMVRSKTWFMVPFVIGGIFEIIGYIGRALSATENPGPYSLAPFIIQSVLLLVAPALFAASLYMELGRIVLMIHGDSALFIRRTWLTKIFVTGDVISFFVQASGAGLLSSGNASSQSYGKYIVVAGLLIQIIFFGLFVIAAAIFHRRMASVPTTQSRERPWTKHMIGLYLVSILIFMRSIVRCVEFVQGYTGYIETHEAFLYCFDAAVMFIAVVTMNITHPGHVARFIREDRESGNTEKSASGREAEGMA